MDVIIDDGATEYTFSGATDGVTYKKTATPLITSLDTTTGSILGGDTLTFTGENLGSLTILIDDIPCTVSSSTTT